MVDMLVFGIGVLLVGLGFLGYIITGISTKQDVIIAKQDAIMAKLIEIKFR